MCVLHVMSSQHSQVKESSQALPVQMEVGMEEGEGELPVRYERDLVQKLKVLRHELSLQQPQAGHCRIEVSREEIFEVPAVTKLNTASHVSMRNLGTFLSLEVTDTCITIRFA